MQIVRYQILIELHKNVFIKKLWKQKNKRNIEIDSLLIHRQGLLIIFKKENFQITDFKMEIRIKRSTPQWCIYQKTIVNN